jgi:hypothetical protein
VVVAYFRVPFQNVLAEIQDATKNLCWNVNNSVRYEPGTSKIPVRGITISVNLLRFINGMELRYTRVGQPLMV